MTDSCEPHALAPAKESCEAQSLASKPSPSFVVAGEVVARWTRERLRLEGSWGLRRLEGMAAPLDLGQTGAEGEGTVQRDPRGERVGGISGAHLK